MTQFYNNAVFWVEVEKIQPNPYQPRREFDQGKLSELAESIRMYGVLQPLVVSRKEIIKEDGGLAVTYELISGERRLRASKLAGITQIPVLIRHGEESDREKLELAIIENLQREDLNSVDRARAFKRLAEEFGFKHADIGRKVGKSREYVSNSMRILELPDEMLVALSEGKISEGHTRPLLMLTTRPEEQVTLFKEILYKRVTVREAEQVARRVAYDRARKKDNDPEILELENKFRESLGTRVHIEKFGSKEGGKLSIDFFSPEDLRSILTLLESNAKNATMMLDRHIANVTGGAPESVMPEAPAEEVKPVLDPVSDEVLLDDRSRQEREQEENQDLYDVKNFTV